jgi:hypothetical protein
MKSYLLINCEDFEIRYDNVDDENITLCWILKKTNKYQGIYIFNNFVEFLKGKNFKYIRAYCSNGITIYDHKIIQLNGYYTLLKWKFIPSKGINFINKTLKTNYKDFDEMYNDKTFWNRWKTFGKDFYAIYKIL